jgi:hypothetical protein
MSFRILTPNSLFFFISPKIATGSKKYPILTNMANVELENLSFGQGSNNNYYCPMWQPSSGDAATDSLLGGKKKTL